MPYNCLRDNQSKKCRPQIEMSMTGMIFTDFKINYCFKLCDITILRSGYF